MTGDEGIFLGFASTLLCKSPRRDNQRVEVRGDSFSGGLKPGDRCINPPVVDPRASYVTRLCPLLLILLACPPLLLLLLQASPPLARSSSTQSRPPPFRRSHRDSLAPSPPSRLTVIFDVVTSRDLIFI